MRSRPHVASRVPRPPASAAEVRIPWSRPPLCPRAELSRVSRESPLGGAWLGSAVLGPPGLPVH